MRLLWLPEVLRDAGLDVTEWPGWKTRGGDTFDPRGIICHATAGSSTSTDAGEIRVLLEGSQTAPPPIAQLYLSRSGRWFVIASGRCNHALTGWGGPLRGLGNTSLIGVEAQNDNRGQAWPVVQLESYQRGVAAICRRMGWNPDRNVAAHREHQPYPPPSWTRSSKSDPHGIDMAKFRQAVSALLAGGLEDDMTPEELAGWDGFTNPYPDYQQNPKITLNTFLLNIGRDARGAVDKVNGLAGQVKELASAVQELRATPPGTVVISDEQLERVLRRVVGSVDGASPPASGT